MSLHCDSCSCGQVAVGVPAAMEDLDVAHAAFGQAPGVQAAGREGAGLAGLFAVELEGRFGFAGQIHQFGHRGLHAVGHLVLLDAREDFGVAEPLVLLLVEGRQRVELGAAVLARDARRVAQVEHRIALAAQQTSLMLGRQKAGSPEAVEQALLGEIRLGVHHDVAAAGSRSCCRARS